jgi:pimeloyl-ACP methyl ester carboxylesterase
VGESFGGCLALRVAAAAPELVARLVLVNPATCFQQSLFGISSLVAATGLLSIFPKPLYEVTLWCWTVQVDPIWGKCLTSVVRKGLFSMKASRLVRSRQSFMKPVACSLPLQTAQAVLIPFMVDRERVAPVTAQAVRSMMLMSAPASFQVRPSLFVVFVHIS